LAEVRIFTLRDVSDAQNIAEMIIRSGPNSPMEGHGFAVFPSTRRRLRLFPAPFTLSPKRETTQKMRSALTIKRLGAEPTKKKGIQVPQTGRLPTQQAAQKIPPHILYARLNFAFGLSSVWPAQSRSETPITRKVQKHRVPDDLAALVRARPDGLHPIVVLLPAALCGLGRPRAVECGVQA